VGHFFGAIKIENFMPLKRFKATMDEMIQGLKNSQKAEGQNRIYIHGEKEFEKYDEYKKNGVPIEAKVLEQMKKVGDELGIKYDIEK
jgi:L-2-hydroxycarboxylate dehydrogenase (NAD+)